MKMCPSSIRRRTSKPFVYNCIYCITIYCVTICGQVKQRTGAVASTTSSEVKTTEADQSEEEPGSYSLPEISINTESWTGDTSRNGEYLTALS